MGVQLLGPRNARRRPTGLGACRSANAQGHGGSLASRAGLWLSVLERSGLVCLLEPWFGHAGRRLSCSPKLD